MPKDETEVKKKATPALTDGPHVALRIALGSAGVLLLVGFFLPWLRLTGVDPLSGLELVIADEEAVVTAIGATQRWLLILVPLLGVGLTAVGFLGLRFSGQVGFGVGLAIIGYGAFTVIALFVQTTAIGLWLVLGGAFLALNAGLFAWVKAKADRPRAD